MLGLHGIEESARDVSEHWAASFEGALEQLKFPMVFQIRIPPDQSGSQQLLHTLVQSRVSLNLPK